MSDYTVTVGEGDKSSSWPNPGAEVIHDVEWRLRYGDPSRTDLLVAAHVMAAYGALLGSGSCGANNRVDVLRALMRATRRS